MNRRWFLAGLLASAAVAGVSADARMHHPYRAHRIVPVATPPLDGFTQPAGAYSFRRLKSNYAGPSAKIRRTTGGTLDVGFTASGDFDTAAAATFCAATTCFADTIYDQSGNVRHLVQISTADQPQLIFNCIGDKPCFRFDATDYIRNAVAFATTGKVSMSVVSRRVSGLGGASPIQHTGAPGAAIYFYTAAGSYNLNSTQNILAPAAENAWHTAIGVVNAASSTFTVDGVTVAGSLSTVAQSGLQTIGGAAGTVFDWTEMASWENYAMIPAEVASLGDNQRNYWTPAPLDTFSTPSGAYSFRRLKSNYVGPAAKLRRVDTTTQDITFTANGDFDIVAAATFCISACTVQTMYDQSGNGLHMVQATAASQPSYVPNCLGAKPCLYMAGGGQGLLAAGNFTPNTKVSLAGFANRVAPVVMSYCTVLNTNSGGGVGNRITTELAADTWTVAGSGGGITTWGAAPDTAWNSAIATVDGANSTVSMNGVQPPWAATLTFSPAAGPPGINGGANCRWTEAYFWNNYTLSSTEVVALAKNQKDYWLQLPLDGFAPAVAYSFRKLKSTYSGPAIRIRRASDNLETDINFLGFTGFTGAPLDTAAANAHCAATTCTLRTFYDQSGNARDLVQTTAASQPQIIFNCLAGLPCIAEVGGLSVASVGTLTPASPLFLSVVGTRQSLTAGYCTPLSVGPNQLNIDPGASTWFLSNGSALLYNYANDGQWHTILGAIAGAASEFSFDGAAPATGTVAINAAVGTISSSGTNNCRVAELIAWNGYAMTTAEKAALPANQKSFWGTP